MADTKFTRAQAGAQANDTVRVAPQVAGEQLDLQGLTTHMYALMLRNISSDGFQFSDPNSPGQFSKSGCVIAAPSYPAELPTVNQDYVFNWVRDAALTALELVAAIGPGDDVQPLVDYVNFASLCQGNAQPTLGHACFTIEGQSRPWWSEQNDGPALQIIAMLEAFPLLDPATQATATAVINTNLQFILEHYQDATYNLWEEHEGLSFFARSAQLRCLQAISANSPGIAVPPGTAQAIEWLEDALRAHWNAAAGYYMTLLAPPAPGNASQSAAAPGYDPNIDIVMAAVYGAVPYSDTKLLATAARLRSGWADSSSSAVYQINLADQQRGLGPMCGRYPGDTYDGDTSDQVAGGHPWALCTCNFAQLYYGLAAEIAENQTVPHDDLSEAFFAQIGVDAQTTPAAAVTALQDAGDRMLQAVLFHSDHLELSEQFDGTSGYEKSVRNLTWSYASFLSALRARSAIVAAVPAVAPVGVRG